MATKAELEKMATQVKGMGVDDETANDILALVDWTGFWPVAKDEKFTGEICGANSRPEGGPEAGYELSEDLMYAIKING